MRAAMLREPCRVEVTEVARPEAGPGEILVEMRAVGLCGSDLHTFLGEHPFRKPPVILGHEGAGRVARVPAGADGTAGFAEGDRVAIMPSVSCWECQRCEAGLPHLCRRKRVPGSGWPGLLGEYACAPGRVLFRLADTVGYAEGAMIEPLAVAWHAARIGSVSAGSSVAVLGAGAIGSLVASVCRLQHTGTLMVTDVKEYNLRFITGIGAGQAVDAGRDDVVERGLSLTQGEGFDTVIAASGHPSCLDEALALCRPRGTAVILPMFGSRVAGDLNQVVLKEIYVRGSTTYTPDDFRAAARLVNTRQLDVRPFITEVLPLGDAPAVLDSIRNGRDYLKVQFDPAR